MSLLKWKVFRGDHVIVNVIRNSEPALLRRKINIRRPFYGGGWPAHFPPTSTTVVERSNYRGQRYLELACTQLDPPYKPTDQKRILSEWCDFFRNPSRVRELGIFTRTPQELFDAVCCGGKIQRLHVKWGPVANLNPLQNLEQLDGLWLGTTSVDDLSPIGELPQLTHLALDNLYAIQDYAVLAKATRLEFLYIDGYDQGPKKLRIKDLKFLRKLPRLRALSIGYANIETFDLDSILALENLEFLDLPDIGRVETKRLDQHADTIRSKLRRLRYGNVADHDG